MSSKSASNNRTRLEHLEAAMERAWHSLVKAEEDGAANATLEKLFATYMAALEALVDARIKGVRQTHVA